MGSDEIFFVSRVNIQKYFQTVIDALIRKSNENFNLLIENAIAGFFKNSKFKYFTAVHKTMPEKYFEVPIEDLSKNLMVCFINLF